MMKIAYLTGQYPRATDTFIQREIFALRALGIEILTFSVRKPSLDQLVGQEQKTEYDQTIYLLPPRIFRLILAHIFLIFANVLTYFKALKLAWDTRQPGFKGLIFQLFYFAEAGYLARELQGAKVQHLHNHIADSSCTVAMLAAELSGISFSFTIHGPYIFFEPYRWTLDEKIKRALFVACISNFCRSQCMLFSSPEIWSKLHIIHCGVEPELFTAREHQGLGTKLLYVGRLAAAKGLPILFEAIAALKSRCSEPIVLTVIGDGSDRLQLEHYVAELGIEQQIQFVGYKSQSEVRTYLQEADIFVLPSFAEGVPVSLMEAMASGIPVISTRIAGISELVEDGKSGYLVPPGHVEQLVHKIEMLYQQPNLRQSFGDAGKQFVSQEFDLANEAYRLSKILGQSLQHV